MSQTLFIFVVLALYDLFKGVNQRRASLMWFILWLLVKGAIPKSSLPTPNSLISDNVAR
jgi:hypothetical protein